MSVLLLTSSFQSVFATATQPTDVEKLQKVELLDKENTEEKI